MRYWRHYPKFLQVILLMLMIFTLSSFSGVIAHLGLKGIFGLSMSDISDINARSSGKAIAAAQFVQGILSLFTFLLSALLFAHLTHPAAWQYLGMRKPGMGIQIIIVALMLVSFMPFVNQIGTWMQKINFGEGNKLSFQKNQEMMQALMRGTSNTDLFKHLFLFALLPAIGEELLFRGIIMRFSYSNSKNIHFAILISAAIFGIAHGSAYNFFPIMLMGILLGYIYYLSGSIWLSMLAHFINNALAALGLFLFNKSIVSDEVAKAENFPWYVLIISVALFIFLFSLLRKNATPLSADWSDDYKGEQQTIN